MISQFGHRYRAVISTDMAEDLYYPVTENDRQIQLFNVFKKFHCEVIKFKELKTRKNSIVKKYEVEFEDGEGGVAYSDIKEIMQLIPDIKFQMIQVIK